MASVTMLSTSFPNTPNQDGSAVAAEVSTPVVVSGADGLRAAEVRIQFDPNEVTTDASQIRSGSIWGGNAAVIANVNQDAGTIVAFVFSVNPVTSGEGGLIDIDFTSQVSAQHDRPAVIDIQKVRLNEGQISLLNEPVIGPDASDGRIHTIVSGGADYEVLRTRGSFVADVAASDESCGVVTGNWQPDTRYENFSWQNMRTNAATTMGPRPEVQGPLPPDAVDDVFQSMFSPHTTKQDFNVRATWHVR